MTSVSVSSAVGGKTELPDPSAKMNTGSLGDTSSRLTFACDVKKFIIVVLPVPGGG